VFVKKMSVLQCITFNSVEITKKMECRRLQSPSGKSGLDLVIVGLAVVIAGLDFNRPLF
jgi:hypothetical protein